MLLDLLHPLLHSREGITVCDVENNDNSVGASVVALSDCFEPALASSVPDLQLDLFVVELDLVDLEVDTDSGHLLFFKLVVSVTGED